MTTTDSSLLAAVRDLESVTTEISLLRDAVAGHRDATSGLDAVASNLGQLAVQLRQLPGEIRSQFSGVSPLVSSLEAALRPAGALETSINSLAAENAQLLEQLRGEREALQTELRGSREDVRQLREAVKELHEQAASRGSAAHASISALTASFAAMHADVREVSTISVDSARKLTELLKRHEEQSVVLAKDADAMKIRLAKLTGLARRGFFAILRGKDAPPMHSD